MQVGKELQRLSSQADDPELVPFRNKPLVKENERAEARAVDKLHPRKIENDVFIGLGEALDVGPDSGNIGSVEIIINFMLLGHGTITSEGAIWLDI